jgi:hypothetical protein
MHQRPLGIDAKLRTQDIYCVAPGSQIKLERCHTNSTTCNINLASIRAVHTYTKPTNEPQNHTRPNRKGRFIATVSEFWTILNSLYFSKYRQYHRLTKLPKENILFSFDCCAHTISTWDGVACRVQSSATQAHSYMHLASTLHQGSSKVVLNY